MPYMRFKCLGAEQAATVYCGEFGVPVKAADNSWSLEFYVANQGVAKTQEVTYLMNTNFRDESTVVDGISEASLWRLVFTIGPYVIGSECTTLC